MTPPPRLPSRRPAGFTMIELVVTMIIVGILAVAVLPRLDLIRGFDEIGYRDKVRATLEYARKSAVALRRNVKVEIVASSPAVSFLRQTPEGEGAANWAPLNLPGASTHTFAAPNGVSLTPATATVTFDPLGRPATASSFVVSGGAGTITIEAETGHVH